MDETLTVIPTEDHRKSRRTLESTNACEPMIDTVQRTQRKVKHWTSGMGLQWTAAGVPWSAVVSSVPPERAGMVVSVVPFVSASNAYCRVTHAAPAAGAQAAQAARWSCGAATLPT